MKFAFRFERKRSTLSRAFIIIDAPNASAAFERVAAGVDEKYLTYADLPDEYEAPAPPKLVAVGETNIVGLSRYCVKVIK